LSGSESIILIDGNPNIRKHGYEMKKICFVVLCLLLSANAVHAAVGFANFSLTPKSNTMSLNLSPLFGSKQAAIDYYTGSGQVEFRNDLEGKGEGNTMGGTFEMPISDDDQFFVSVHRIAYQSKVTGTFQGTYQGSPVSVDLDYDNKTSRTVLDLHYIYVSSDTQKALRIGMEGTSNRIDESESALITNTATNAQLSSNEEGGTDYSLLRLSLTGNVEISEGFRVGGNITPASSTTAKYDGDYSDVEVKQGYGTELALALGYLQDYYSIEFDVIQGYESPDSHSRSFIGYGLSGEYVIDEISLSGRYYRASVASYDNEGVRKPSYQYQSTQAIAYLPVHTLNIGFSINQDIIDDFEEISDWEKESSLFFGLTLMKVF
jgi:hypothetical protein